MYDVWMVIWIMCIYMECAVVEIECDVCVDVSVDESVDGARMKCGVDMLK